MIRPTRHAALGLVAEAEDVEPLLAPLAGPEIAGDSRRERRLPREARLD